MQMVNREQRTKTARRETKEIVGKGYCRLCRRVRLYCESSGCGLASIGSYGFDRPQSRSERDIVSACAYKIRGGRDSGLQKHRRNE